MSVFVACKKENAPNPSNTPSMPSGEPNTPSIPDSAVSFTFFSNNEEIATKIDINKAKEILASQPAREGYEFKGWYLDKDTWQKEVTSANVEETVKDDVNVYAYWIEVVDQITVRFLDYTGAELLEKIYERSDDQLQKDLARLRPSNYEDEQYEYIFDKWDCDVSDKSKDSYIATPIYISELRIFEVNFYVEGKLYYTDFVRYGDDADLSKVNNPTKPMDDVFKYEFIGWVGNLENITQNTNVTAKFDEIYVIVYTVVFTNWEGSVLETVKVESGEPAVYSKEIPTREQNEMYTYEFAGWTTSNDDADLENVTCNFVATANFEENIRTYTITFVDDNEDIIKVLSEVPYGTDLRSTTAFSLPTDEETYMESTAKYEYKFIDWDQYLSRVYSDMTVKAMYAKTIRRYIVKYISNGVAILTQEVEYGQYPTLPTVATVMNDTAKWAFGFLGWQVLEADTTLPGSGSDIDPDDGTDLRTTLLSSDGFEAVDPANSEVQGEITYTAIFTRTIQQYTIRFFNDKDYLEFLTEITVPWGTNVIEQALVSDPTKESVPKWDYKFETWNRYDDLTKIVSSFDVYADYLAILRYYWVTYMDGENEYKKYHVAFDDCAPIPDSPTKVSTLEFDFEFKEWDRLPNRVIEGDTVINAIYNNNTRSYVVTLFNLATRELISTGEFNYGTKITSKINFNGYDFDSWYRDPDCNTVFNQEEEFVDGPMMLFGNIVMKGLLFNDNNEIVGYDGVEDSYTNLIIPMAANGRKVSTIKSKALAKSNIKPNSIGSIFIPITITKVENFAFSGLVITETGGLYLQAKKASGSLTRPSGWDEYWNRDSMIAFNEGNRPVTYGVDGVYTVDNFQYMMFPSGVAYVDKFINNSVATAYIPSNAVVEKASFSTTTWVDEGKTEETRLIYTTEYTESTYNVTQIAVSAFEGCVNLTTIFVPSTIEKINNYAFSGLTASIYIAKSKPASEEFAWSLTGTTKWNNHRKGQEGSLNIVWDVIGMDIVGDYSYIFKTGNAAIAAQYLGGSAKTKVEVPGSVTYKDEVYTVEEIADEIFANMAALNTVTVGEGVKKIGSKAFYMDMMLKTVNLPSTLEEIGSQAFVACMPLNQIYIPAKVSKIGSLAFIGIDNLTIYLGNKKTLGLAPTGYALGWNTKIGFSDLGDLDMSSILKSITTILGKFTQTHETIWEVAGLPQVDKSGTALPGEYTYLLYNDGHAELIASNVPVGSLNTSYTIPEAISYNGVDYAVTTIRATAFAGNTRIKELIIPTSVTSIPAGAFEGCSSLIIKTAHTSKPSGWDNNFNVNGDGVVQVQWSYGVSASTEEVE
ncbi:MAG: leucine-rich repeat protein [Clostridia bacterium]|nr:leucine-rich repeat protein [Clostridia bacterium]